MTQEAVNIVLVNGKSVTALGGTTIDPSGNLDQVAIVNCDDSQCVQTQGIVKNNDAYYSISPASNALIESTDYSGASCSGNAGKLQTITRTVAGVAQSPVVELCLSNEKSTPLTTGASNFLLEGTALNAVAITITGENSGATNRVINVGTNYFVYDALFTTGKYRWINKWF